MGMQELDQAFALVEQHGGGDFAGGKKEEQIKQAEELLRLTFPPTYRKFLSKLGCGDIEGCEFYGLSNLGPDAFGIPNVVWLSNDLRKIGMPENLIPVYSGSDGSYHVLDTSRIDLDGENPVVVYEIDGSISHKAADNFGEFILSELKEMI